MMRTLYRCLRRSHLGAAVLCGAMFCATVSAVYAQEQAQTQPLSENSAAQQSDESADAGALAPKVTSELMPDEVAPGQSARLRVTVLVPTYMPRPVEFADLDQANLRVRLGERATTPLSRRMDGRTWSGVTRTYQLTPLAPGQYNLGPAKLTITFQHPDSGEIVSEAAETDVQTLTATVPPAAAGLSPYIAGRSLSLSQTFTTTRAGAEESEGAVEQIDASSEGTVELAVGDSLKRDITLAIEGGSVLLLPSLNEQASAAGMEVYTASPKVSEHEAGGERSESVTYIAQQSGHASLPSLSLRWYDTQSEKVATVQLEGLALSIKGGGFPAVGQRSDFACWWLLMPLLGLLLLLWACRRWLLPLWQQRQQKLAQQQEALGVGALADLHKAAKARHYAASLTAWQHLQQCVPVLSAHRRAAVIEALAGIGQQRYGTGAGTETSALWQTLEQALPSAGDLRASAEPGVLPELNPHARPQTVA
ncbi:Oxygen tolerance [Halopseudomonas sabulinigri]|uniref:Oxygen tolerance n=1 Tax=Halopseudomonas sabulinigri TaxID=472181 RepID=A0A1H1L9Q4_9GAMM|nr:BatD family protein [Halopseudomonas sabulinigri]SDR71070.1 Oxygen tolerance [Halopseudomonas sabulinigri]